jgi:hypothetical protein
MISECGVRRAGLCRQPPKVSLTTSSPNPLLQGEGFDVPRVLGKIQRGIGQTIIRASETVAAKILSPGERTQVRASVKTNFPELLRFSKFTTWPTSNARDSFARMTLGRKSYVAVVA